MGLSRKFENIQNLKVENKILQSYEFGEISSKSASILNKT